MDAVRQWISAAAAWWRRLGARPPARTAAEREAIDRVRSRLLRQLEDDAPAPARPKRFNG